MKTASAQAEHIPHGIKSGLLVARPERGLDGAGNIFVAHQRVRRVGDDGVSARCSWALRSLPEGRSRPRHALLDSIALLASCIPPDPTIPADDLSDASYSSDHARCSGFGGAVVVAAPPASKAACAVVTAGVNGTGRGGRRR